MSKGRVDDFIGLYRAIFKDCAAYYPTLSKGFDRDLSRLTALYENSGESVFTILLPALGKHLDAALEAGCLSQTGLPLTRPINTRTVIPRLFQGLWSQLFSDTGCLKQHIDPNAILFLRTLCLVGKKFRKDCSPTVKYETIKEFYDVDNRLPPPDKVFDGDGSAVWDVGDVSVTDLTTTPVSDTGQMSFWTDDQGLQLLNTCQHVADRVAGLIGDFVPGDFRFKHGPGATAEAPRGGSYKYAFSAWSPRLQHVFPGEVFAIANTSVLGDGYDIGDLLEISEHPSRLIAVPKTQKGPRLIAKEPACHQWAQQCVRDFLDTRIRETWLGGSIDFRRQDLSAEAARAASLSGKYATIDLKSASDRLSCWLVSRLFRSNKPLLEAMISCRTRYVYNDLDKKHPSVHKLRKFSTQGSALTFPVQSIVFLMVCIAAGISHDGVRPVGSANLRRYAQQVRVYGDDLIVPVEWVPRVKELLERLFLKVNMSKTFWNGMFRESCGMDAYEGHDVTPPYFLQFHSRARLATLDSLVDVSNNFFKKGFWHTAKWIEMTVPWFQRKLIPTKVWRSDASTEAQESEVFGFVSSSGFSTEAPRRFNRDLQRDEYFTLATSVDKPKHRSEGFPNLLQFFTEDPASTHWLDKPSEWVSGVYGNCTPKMKRAWVPVPA